MKIINRSTISFIRHHSLESMKYHPPKNKTGEVTLSQLRYIEQFLTPHIPKFFAEYHPYVMYRKDVIFENHFNPDQPIIYKGVSSYVMQLTKYRLISHARYGFVRLKVVNAMDLNEENGTVGIRWRAEGIRNSTIFFKPWTIKFWQLKSENHDSLKNAMEWIDGRSTLFVDGTSCLIYKHVLDRIDIDREEDEKPLADIVT
ncbi:hypothetical protein SNEBB_000660 [Seison nebaliae]|nr:hypothetical protein SNEBB_000660 [Seison nebaliae]